LIKNEEKILFEIIFIHQCLKAIDDKNKKEIEILFEKYNNSNIINNNDVVFEMYNNNQLNSERLQFIIENCMTYLNISSKLIKKLMKYEEKELLEIIFKKHLKFFDNEIIINLLSFYKNKTAMSNFVLYHLIDDDK